MSQKVTTNGGIASRPLRPKAHQAPIEAPKRILFLFLLHQVAVCINAKTSKSSAYIVANASSPLLFTSKSSQMLYSTKQASKKGDGKKDYCFCTFSLRALI